MTPPVSSQAMRTASFARLAPTARSYLRFEARDGYCQNPQDKSKIWLFTVNGQRFPTITIPSGQNGLWRVANLSANATYLVSLRDVSANQVPFDLLSVDGVVPGTPKEPSASTADNPEATKVSQLLLMPAGRAEIFVSNTSGDTTTRRLVFQTDGQDAGGGGDVWPQIKLAEIILEGAPAVAAGPANVGLNVALARPRLPQIAAAPSPAPYPKGCVRDINKAARERRRIRFQRAAFPDGWSITTEIVEPNDKTQLQNYTDVKIVPEYIDPFREDRALSQT